MRIDTKSESFTGRSRIEIDLIGQILNVTVFNIYRSIRHENFIAAL
jgi:hypothetical protein